MSGDPRASTQAIMSVIAAALANGGSLDDVQPGLEFFKQLNEAGNFVPVIAKQATVAKGETPVITRWDYNALADKDTLAGNLRSKWSSRNGRRRRRVHPGHQRLRAASQRRQAVDGIPVLGRGPADLAQGRLPPHPLQRPGRPRRDPGRVGSEALPPAEDYAKAVFPTLEQLNAAAKTITENWDTMVGADVK